MANSPPEMQAVRIGRYLNSSRSVQIFGELPGGALVQLNQGDATILLPNQTAFRAMRMSGRCVWSRGAHNHINPGAPGAGRGRLYQFVAKASSISKHFGGYRTSIFSPATAWSAGARRREGSQPELFMCLGDLFGVINVRAPSYDQLSPRGWWPATGEEWLMANP